MPISIWELALTNAYYLDFTHLIISSAVSSRGGETAYSCISSGRQYEGWSALDRGNPEPAGLFLLASEFSNSSAG